jgi:hypothetical protein
MSGINSDDGAPNQYRLRNAPLGRKWRLLIPVLVVGAFAAGAGDEPPRPILFLRLIDSVGVADGALRRASNEVSIILSEANVDTVWTDEAPRQPAAGAVGAEVEILLLSEEESRAPIAKFDFTYDYLGYVVRPELRAYVFWSHIRAAAFHASRDAGEVLGLVIAHEVGHLLLPDGEHSSTGIMQAAFDLSVRWPQRFAPEDAALIHAALAHWPNRSSRAR